MTTADTLAHAEPTDLDQIRTALAHADPDKRLRPIGLRRIDIGPEALSALPDMVAECARPGRLVLLMDATPMQRLGRDLKPMVEQMLRERFLLERRVLGNGRALLQADEGSIETASAAILGAGCAVAVGSGTLTDISKEATRRAGGVPLVVLQTAASVNAFSDDMAVLLRQGVKRTVPSRWPDALLVDIPTLAGAPPAMNAAGFGDLLAAWTAPADWHLAHLLGMDDGFHPAPGSLLREPVRELLASASGLRNQDPAALERLARVLTLSGLVMGIAGTTAPLSGTEHLISHLVDMMAKRQHRELAFHGAQVAVAAILTAAAWQILLDELEPGAIGLDACFPSDAAMEQTVRAAFAGLDDSGQASEECWREYARKLDAWHQRRARLETFLREWPHHRDVLRQITLPPETLAAALREAGAPARFSQLDPPAGADTVRWAVRNCHLMRNRFCVADLLFFLGWWNEAFVERLLARAAGLSAGI